MSSDHAPTDRRPADYGVRPVVGLDGAPLEWPDLLERWAGYGEDRRFVSFYWGAGDSPVYDDGAVSGTGHYGPWLVWSRHVSVRPSLAGLDLGSSDAAHAHRLVLDRFTRRLHAGREGDVARFLADAPDLRAQREAWEALTEGERDAVRREAGDAFRRVLDELRDLDGWAEGGGDPAALVREAERFDRAAFARLTEWLDARPVPCPSCGATHDAGDYDPDDLGRPECPTCGGPFYSQALIDWLHRLRRGG